MMRVPTYLFSLVVLFSSLSLSAQKERSEVRKGVKELDLESWSEAEVFFRRAEEIKPGSVEAHNNIGHALYGQEKFEESEEQYTDLLEKTDDKDLQADLWYNRGNSLLKAGKIDESVEAYKQSLRSRPGDEDARYNLAYARKLQQQQQQQENQDQQSDEQSDQQEQSEDQSDQDQQSDDQSDQQEQSDEQNDQQEQSDEQSDQQEQAGKPQAVKMSKEDAERMLKAIAEKEKEVKDKVDKQKAAAARVKSDKDW